MNTIIYENKSQDIVVIKEFGSDDIFLDKPNCLKALEFIRSRRDSYTTDKDYRCHLEKYQNALEHFGQPA